MTQSLIADRYRLVRAIGRGAVGEVWLGDDLVLSRQVAIKRLTVNPAAGFDSDAIERIVREARVAARLHHPNVVSVFDFVTDQGAPYIVMEYVDGESLEARMRRVGALATRDARDLIAQAAEGLAAAHARGIVHRDVKPANILIDATSGVAKLADFGIARGEGDAALTITGQTVGTIAYMAPEVARGGAATAASDVWSLGVTLFSITQGHSPYDDGRASQSAIGLLMRIASEPLPTVPDGPLRTVISEMLAADPADRPSARDVARVLGAAPPRPVLTRPTEPAAEPRSAEITLDRPAAITTHRSARHTATRRSRRRGWLMALVGVIAVAAAAIAIVIGLSGSGSSPPPAAMIYSPAALALTGDGASGSYAAGTQNEVLGGQGGLTVLDSSTSHAIRFIPVDPNMTVTQVIVAATGDIAYAAEVPNAVNPFHEDGKSLGAVAKVDLTTKAVKSLTLCGDPVPRGMVMSPDGSRLLIATDDCNEVVDTASMTRLNYRTSADVGSGPPPTITKDGLTGYAAEASGVLIQISMATGEIKPTGGKVPGVRGVIADPDGRYLYLLAPYGLNSDGTQRGQLVPVDVSAAKPVFKGAVTLGFGAYAAAVSPDGNYVVVAASGYDDAGRPLSDGTVTIIDTKTLSASPLTVPGGRGTIAFSADGRALFVANAAGEITKIDMTTKKALPSVRGGGGYLFRSADPDVIYATNGRSAGVAIDVTTGQPLRPVTLSG